MFSSGKTDENQLVAAGEVESHIPLDQEGWQISDGSSVAENFSTQEWTVATSKHALRKKLKRSKGGHIIHHQTHNGLNSVGDHSTSDGKKERRRNNRKKKKAKGKGKVDTHANQTQQSNTNIPHRDEPQVELDVQRSFLHLGDTSERRKRREQLLYIIQHVLRAHPMLHYYQGYHDVVSVLLVTLIPDPHSVHLGPSVESDGTTNTDANAHQDVVPTTSIVHQDKSSMPSADATLGDAETLTENSRFLLHAVLTVTTRFSLHYLRDAMTADMIPILGHLKVLRSILQKECDENSFERIDMAAPLPYFALPWILSVFCHDLDIDLSQHVLDFVLLRGPTSVILLAASIISEQATQSQLDSCSDAAEVHHTLAQSPTTITATSLPKQMTAADAIGERNNIDQGTLLRPIMGPHSTLFTWKSLPPHHHSYDWEYADKEARNTLQGSQTNIVINAQPSPPPTPPLHADAYVDDEKLLAHRKRTAGHSSPPALSLVWMGAVGAIGMALWLAYGTPPVRESAILFRTAQPWKQLVQNAMQH